ncbi:MAG: hypothetical protein K1X94_13465 [Sandaracinaceae bacterium]|nr:hypothetical protein [Sandaracinaceae bacterium]
MSPQTQGRGGSDSVLGSQNRYESATCPATYWRFFALRHPSLDDDPLQDPGDPGLYPPVVVMREINGCCIDQWSATIRAVEPLDAGADAP